MTLLPLLLTLLQSPTPPPAAQAEAVAPPPAAPAAPSKKGAVVLAPKLGLFKSTSDLGPAFFAGGEVGYVVPIDRHGLAITLEVDYASSLVDGTVTDAQLAAGVPGDYKVRERQLALVLGAAYRHTVSDAFVAYGGLGPGIYWHKAIERAFATKNEETEGSFGLRLLAGGELRAGPGGVFAELHYHFTQVGFVSTGEANVGGFVALGVGYRLRFDL